MKRSSLKKSKRNCSESRRIMDIACPICLNPFTMQCDISTNQCGHMFHSNCITKWIETRKKTCPQCRKSCTLEKLIKLYLPATGNVKKRDVIQADLDFAEALWVLLSMIITFLIFMAFFIFLAFIIDTERFYEEFSKLHPPASWKLSSRNSTIFLTNTYYMPQITYMKITRIKIL